jgi:hypothetical protein
VSVSDEEVNAAAARLWERWTVSPAPGGKSLPFEETRPDVRRRYRDAALAVLVPPHAPRAE